VTPKNFGSSSDSIGFATQATFLTYLSVASKTQQFFGHLAGSSIAMLITWQQRKQQESYLGQLEQILVGRLRQNSDNRKLTAVETMMRGEDLSEFSRDINAELGRLEQLVVDVD
jgi:hypothetical protein